MKTAGKITGFVLGLGLIGFVGCSTGNLSSQKPGRSTQYSLENILPDKYKSMKLELIGTLKRKGAGDSYRTEEGEFVVTSFYQDGNRKLSSEEMDARERIKGNLPMRFKNRDYSLMIVYQICDGDISNKKPVMIYAPHDGERGATWMFQQPKGSEGRFNDKADLYVKFRDFVLENKERFSSMSREEFNIKKAEAIKPTFTNCGRKTKMHNHRQEGHHHGRGHKHGLKKKLA